MYHPGQKYRPSAARENEIDRLLRDARAGSGSYMRNDLARMPMGHVLAKNESGADLGFAAATIYYFDDLVVPDLASNNWDMRDNFLRLAPFADVVSEPGTGLRYGGMAVTQEPIAQNQIGVVAIAGPSIFSPKQSINDNVLRDSRYVAPFAPPLYDRLSYWGFMRILCYDSNPQYAIVDLSDRHLTTQYVLTANMNSSATATLGGGASAYTWTTTVHDVHALAAFQRTGDKGWCEWRGDRWVVTVPFCT